MTRVNCFGQLWFSLRWIRLRKVKAREQFFALRAKLIIITIGKKEKKQFECENEVKH